MTSGLTGVDGWSMRKTYQQPFCPKCPSSGQASHRPSTAPAAALCSILCHLSFRSFKWKKQWGEPNVCPQVPSWMLRPNNSLHEVFFLTDFTRIKFIATGSFVRVLLYHLLFQEFKIIKQLIAWENQKLLVLVSLVMTDDYLKGITFLI